MTKFLKDDFFTQHSCFWCKTVFGLQMFQVKIVILPLNFLINKHFDQMQTWHLIKHIFLLYTKIYIYHSFAQQYKFI